jgi:hypothetical protein
MLEHVNKVNITFCNVSDHGKLTCSLPCGQNKFTENISSTDNSEIHLLREFLPHDGLCDFQSTTVDINPNPSAHSCVMLEHVNKVNITFCNVSDHGKLIMFVFV